MTRNTSRNVAMLARLDKERHPQNYCPVSGCLYRTAAVSPYVGNSTLCPKHIQKLYPECTCENNGDYCDRCNALVELREQLPHGGRSFLAQLRAMGCPNMPAHDPLPAIDTHAEIAQAIDDGLDVYEVFG